MEKLLSFYKTDDKDKALRNAVVNGRLKDATLLLKWGANINAQDNNPISLRTALHDAAIKGNQEMMALLMEHHADNTILDTQGKRAQGYLHVSPRP